MPEVLARSPRERAERRVGSTLLKWKLDALLGIGGMAAVYAATHKNRSRVALKVLHRELALNLDIRERFLREAYVANTVGHPGVVQVLDDHVSEDDEPFLVMELLDGRSLEAVQTARGKLPAGEVLDIADEMLDALAAAHDKGIVHRDIKPQNVFLTRAGQTKVLDFGVARILEGAASATATGSLLGTPAFMPPEQASGRTSAVCAASDLWSVGATMFTLLTGRFVHEAENAQAHTVKAAVNRARSLATLLPDAPLSLVRLVDRALAFEIEGRFRDAREMQAAVRAARSSLIPDLAPREADDEDNAETRAFSRGAVRAAVAAATAPRSVTRPDTTTNELHVERPGAPTRDPTDGPSPDEARQKAAEIALGATAAPDRIKPHPNGLEPPTLAPRVAAMPAGPVPATQARTPPDAGPASIAAPASDEVTTGATRPAATTSVVLVPAPAFPGTRPSNPGAPPAPPPPTAGSPPPGTLEAFTPAPSSSPSPALGTSTTATPAHAPPPLPNVERTLPIGAMSPPTLSSSGFGEHRSPLATAPLPMTIAAEPDPQQPGFRSLTPVPHSSYSNPAATSVGAHSISQISPPAGPKRATLGKLEMAAIAGALAAILLVIILVTRAVTTGDGTPPEASGQSSAAPSGEAAPTSAATGPGAPSTATPVSPASALPSSSAADPAEPAPPVSASPAASASASPATPPRAPPKYQPPRDPGTVRWDKKKKLEPTGL